MYVKQNIARGIHRSKLVYGGTKIVLIWRIVKTKIVFLKVYCGTFEKKTVKNEIKFSS